MAILFIDMLHTQSDIGDKYMGNKHSLPAPLAENKL